MNGNELEIFYNYNVTKILTVLFYNEETVEKVDTNASVPGRRDIGGIYDFTTIKIYDSNCRKGIYN